MSARLTKPIDRDNSGVIPHADCKRCKTHVDLWNGCSNSVLHAGFDGLYGKGGGGDVEKRAKEIKQLVKDEHFVICVATKYHNGQNVFDALEMAGFELIAQYTTNHLHGYSYPVHIYGWWSKEAAPIRIGGKEI